MISEVLHTKWGIARFNGGYYTITSGKEGNHGKRLHRLIYEDFWGVKLPHEIHIHHKDRNPLNNCILNLEAMEQSNHNHLHMIGENNPNYHAYGDKNPFYGKKHSKESIDRIIAKNTGRKHSLKSKLNNSQSKNTIGFFRVTTQPCATCKQGFTYVYKYFDENRKRHSIVSTNLDKLKEKVISKGLEWIEFSEG